MRRKLGHACERKWIKILGFEIVYASRVDGLMTDIWIINDKINTNSFKTSN